ncbi:hypothetical protein [Streptomyces sp. NBC_01334]|uniref:hypothetical protein n=1 Tax=Streptomyces sp. NBC_01334 TaxID=2903827 RepID=UPI002E11865F|nr:hypothetical protein OG736_23745 [Streptomyces sp. NBC_01334]
MNPARLATAVALTTTGDLLTSAVAAARGQLPPQGTAERSVPPGYRPVTSGIVASGAVAKW